MGTFLFPHLVGTSSDIVTVYIVQMAQMQFTSHLSEDIWSSGCYNLSTSFFFIFFKIIY